MKDSQAVPLLTPLVEGPDRALAVEAIRALGRIGDPAGAPPLLKLIAAMKADPTLRLRGGDRRRRHQGRRRHQSTARRARRPEPAGSRGGNPLAGAVQYGELRRGLRLNTNPDFDIADTALATVLGTLPVKMQPARLLAMRDDSDERVVPAVLASLAAMRAPDAVAIVSERLKTKVHRPRGGCERPGEAREGASGRRCWPTYPTGRRTQRTWPVARP